MKTSLTPQSICIVQILRTTALAFGIELRECTRIDPRLLESEFKDPSSYSIAI